MTIQGDKIRLFLKENPYIYGDMKWLAQQLQYLQANGDRKCSDIIII